MFGSYSWSANIFGRKKWLLLPPGEETKLKDSLGNLPFTISTELLNEKSVKFFELLQECNETLFVPSGWFHQVLNVDDSVSVNHNWFNGCNIKHITDNLLQHHQDVEREISDCRDMENFAEHCQLMLKASFGMNFTDLLEILTHLVDSRVRSFNNEETLNFNFTLGKNHINFDLKEIEKILEYLKANESIKVFSNLIQIIDKTLNKIRKTLD